MRNVTLILDDGTRFRGQSFGYEKPVAGEVVFNTAMTGYPESLTDPSYAGQLMTLTYPLVGNYGVPPFTIEGNGLATFMESEKIHAEAIIVSDYSENYSHWNAVESLADWLKREHVPGITGIDTRELTKVLREHGVMMGRIVFDDNEELRMKNEESGCAAAPHGNSSFGGEADILHSSLKSVLHFLSLFQPSRSLADNLGFSLRTIYYGRTFGSSDTTVNHQIDDISPFFIDQFWIGSIFYVFILVIRQGSSHDGCIKQTGYFLNDRIVGHTDTHFFPVPEDLGQTCRPVQDESERPRQITFHQFEGRIIHLGIFTDAAQVVTDDGEVVLFRINVFQAADAFDGTFFQSVTADGIHGVGRIDQESPVVQQVDNALQIGRIVVLVIKLQKHKQMFFKSLGKDSER